MGRLEPHAASTLQSSPNTKEALLIDAPNVHKAANASLTICARDHVARQNLLRIAYPAPVYCVDQSYLDCLDLKRSIYNSIWYTYMYSWLPGFSPWNPDFANILFFHVPSDLWGKTLAGWGICKTRDSWLAVLLTYQRRVSGRSRTDHESCKGTLERFPKFVVCARDHGGHIQGRQCLASCTDVQHW
jgi:hypothetical protein